MPYKSTQTVVTAANLTLLLVLVVTLVPTAILVQDQAFCISDVVV